VYLYDEPNILEEHDPDLDQDVAGDLSLPSPAGVPDLVTRSISGHATEATQHHYSTVADQEQRTALERVAALMAGQSAVDTVRVTLPAPDARDEDGEDTTE
jgi:hypothetical protein